MRRLLPSSGAWRLFGHASKCVSCTGQEAAHQRNMQSCRHELHNVLQGNKGVSTDIGQYYRIFRLYLLAAADEEEYIRLMRAYMERQEEDFEKNANGND